VVAERNTQNATDPVGSECSASQQIVVPKSPQASEARSDDTCLLFSFLGFFALRIPSAVWLFRKCWEAIGPSGAVLCQLRAPSCSDFCLAVPPADCKHVYVPRHALACYFECLHGPESCKITVSKSIYLPIPLWPEF